MSYGKRLNMKPIKWTDPAGNQGVIEEWGGSLYIETRRGSSCLTLEAEEKLFEVLCQRRENRKENQ